MCSVLSVKSLDQKFIRNNLLPKDTKIKHGHGIVRHYIVFNAVQIQGIEPYQRPVLTEFEKHQAAEEALQRSGADIQYYGNRAFYNWISDKIVLPKREQFTSADGFYAVALHELGHWTGHHTRLSRAFSTQQEPEAYAREELRAELASVFLQAELGIPHDSKGHAAYLEHYLKILKSDKHEIFRAARDAQHISDFIMGLSKGLSPEQAKAQALNTSADTEKEPESVNNGVAQRNTISSDQKHTALPSKSISL